jgi:hypothetical protein
MEVLDHERRTLWATPRAWTSSSRILGVSGLHARLERHGGEWSIVDDGLSRNGRS